MLRVCLSLMALLAAPAHAQLNARVLVLITPNGSSSDHVSDNIDTGGDGSSSYTDGVLTRTNLYQGYQLDAPKVCPGGTTFDGVNSRMYAAKQIFNDALTNAPNVDWGLLRYVGSDCPFSSTFAPTTGSCTTDGDCKAEEFCVGSVCGTDPNLCKVNSMGATDTRGALACGNHHDLPTSHVGSCGTHQAAGSAGCNTPLGCQSDADCGGTVGACAPYLGGPAKVCTCGGCPTSYLCSGGICVYNLACDVNGGELLVNPTPTPAPLIRPWIDGIEDFRDDGMGHIVNPELHPVGNTPLAASIRSAIGWYQSAVAADPDAPCRPYALVLLTNSAETCQDDINNGPLAAVRAFVAATQPGVRTPNRVYVLSIVVPTPALANQMAAAGGTVQARAINSASPLLVIASELAPTTGVHACGSSCVDNNGVANCGASCSPCPSPTDGTATCDGTNCGIACNPSFHACTGVCVTNDSVDHCGALCSVCPTPAHGVAACDGTRCTNTCTGDGDCDPPGDPCQRASCDNGICVDVNVCDLASSDLGGGDLSSEDLSGTVEDLAAADLAAIPIPLFPPGHQSGGCGGCGVSSGSADGLALAAIALLGVAWSLRRRRR